MLGQNVRASGGTYHLERHLQSSLSSETAPTEVQPDRDTLSAQVQADLERREAQLRDRQQQTGEAFGEALSSQSRMPVL